MFKVGQWGHKTLTPIFQWHTLSFEFALSRLKIRGVGTKQVKYVDSEHFPDVFWCEHFLMMFISWYIFFYLNIIFRRQSWKYGSAYFLRFLGLKKILPYPRGSNIIKQLMKREAYKRVYIYLVSTCNFPSYKSWDTAYPYCPRSQCVFTV